jgi:hypothetical protein
VTANGASNRQDVVLAPKQNDIMTGLPGGDYSFAVYAINAVGYGPLTSSRVITVQVPRQSLQVTQSVVVRFPQSSYTRNESAYTPFTVKNNGNAPRPSRWAISADS